MKNKFIIFLVFISISFNLLNSEKLIEFSDIYKPLQIGVDNNNLYVSDQYSVKVYSLKNFKLIDKIGKKGSGPGEFPRDLIYFQLLPDNKEILLYQPFHFKAVLFNITGKIVKENKTRNLIRKIYKVSNNFIMEGMNFSPKGSKIELIIFDSNFDKISSIESKTISLKFKNRKRFELKYPFPIEGFKCSDNKVFLSYKRNDFYFEIYDHMGKKLRTIKKDYVNIKIASKQKEKLRKDYFNQPLMIQLKKSPVFKKFKIIVPDIYPAIQDFIIAEQNIYVKTYLRKNNKQEFIVLNYNGEIIKKVYLSIIRNEIFMFEPKLYAIKKNKYYYLKENETYDFFCEQIK